MPAELTAVDSDQDALPTPVEGPLCQPSVRSPWSSRHPNLNYILCAVILSACISIAFAYGVHYFKGASDEMMRTCTTWFIYFCVLMGGAGLTSAILNLSHRWRQNDGWARNFVSGYVAGAVALFLVEFQMGAYNNRDFLQALPYLFTFTFAPGIFIGLIGMLTGSLVGLEHVRFRDPK